MPLARKRQPTGKLVYLFAYEPIGVDKRAEQPWSDTWVRYSNRRKWIRVGPTICAAANLRYDKEMAERMIAEISTKPEVYEQWPGSFAASMVKRDDKLALWQGMLDDYLETEAEVKATGYSIRGWKSTLPSIYTKEEWITRKTAEDAVAALLALRGIPKCRFKWTPIGESIVNPC